MLAQVCMFASADASDGDIEALRYTRCYPVSEDVSGLGANFAPFDKF